MGDGVRGACFTVLGDPRLFAERHSQHTAIPFRDFLRLSFLTLAVTLSRFRLLCFFLSFLSSVTTARPPRHSLAMALEPLLSTKAQRWFMVTSKQFMNRKLQQVD